jgi:membrane-associated phospholipid phosphatase
MLTNQRKKLINYTLAMLIAGFAILTTVVVFLPNNLLDERFSKEVQEHQNPLLDAGMEFISWFGYTPGALITVAVTALLFLLFKYKREALFVVLCLLGGLVSTIVKFFVDRPRPSADIVRVITKTAQKSFPSGHVLFYVLLFGFILLLMNQLKQINRLLRIAVGGICLFLIFSIPFSRIYLGAHWFTDVLGGFILGLLCLYVLSYFYEKGKVSKDAA